VADLVDTGDTAEALSNCDTSENSIPSHTFDNSHAYETHNILDISDPSDTVDLVETPNVDGYSSVSEASQEVEFESAAPVAVEELRPPVPGDAQEIIDNYPAFLTEQFEKIYNESDDAKKLKYVDETLTRIIAFLNLCFVQSCLYYAEESEVLAQNILQCLKNKLVGATALRNLHNFVMAMKPARGNPVFFTFTLAGIMSESSESNPLMLMRELKEYLRAPVQPFAETVPQAIEGLTAILKGIKCIKNNIFVMKTPEGAKEPFADLGGPLAASLNENRRPLLDLPPGEVVIVSKDGSEAFGLYPFVKYNKRKTIFTMPGDAEMKVLFERLDIPLN
jgi:hypothetical protein